MGLFWKNHFASNYVYADASWEKREATATQRMNLWRVTRRVLVQADDEKFLGSSLGDIMQKDCETRPKYFGMDHVFWVKVSFAVQPLLRFLFVCDLKGH